ncbi:hypothetical protein [Chromobacterium violaceum]|uniref:hypothetical protein n=1 Tax=Chromobacterium violaceum TaxID=536 RepID=UPI001056D942|nr:hypothetical protein [Chromobacterium violaceum]
MKNHLLPILFLTTCTSACEKSVTTPPTVTEKTTIIQNERYKIYFSPLIRADTYLLDTQTGRVWQQQLDRNENSVWVEMDVKNKDRKTIDFKDLK